MRLRVYISADYSETNGDRNVVELLHKWGNDNRYKIIECHKDYNSSIIGSISNVDKSGIYLGCEGGNIVVTKLQPAGKKPMDIKSYLNGKSELSIGDVLD